MADSGANDEVPAEEVSAEQMDTSQEFVSSEAAASPDRETIPQSSDEVAETEPESDNIPVADESREDLDGSVQNESMEDSAHNESMEDSAGGGQNESMEDSAGGGQNESMEDSAGGGQNESIEDSAGGGQNESLEDSAGGGQNESMENLDTVEVDSNDENDEGIPAELTVIDSEGPGSPESRDSETEMPPSPGEAPASPGQEAVSGSEDEANYNSPKVEHEVEELATPASPTEEESVGVADRVVAHIEQEIAKKLDAVESSHGGSQSGTASPEPDDRVEKRAQSNEREQPREKKKRKRKEHSEDHARPVELEKYWKAVRNNPSDFTGWTYLLQYVEQENKMSWARESFDAFFKQYPYCYGYWKKYADMEKRHDNWEPAAEVYERGLRAIPLSVDLWMHYINFTMSQWEDDEDRIRRLYERAISASGTDFRSDKLWEQYINWEMDFDLKKVTALYDRAFTIPTLLYSQHFDNFKIFVKKNHPKDILDLDEFLKFRTDVVESKALTSDNVDEMEGPPGGDTDDEAPPGMEPKAKTTTNDAENLAIKEKIIDSREAVYLENEVEVGKRWSYEEGIRRPYFHVKPLERAQLKNWREYLDFEIENGTHERAVVLFERCMIACALYEDFWMKYARYLERHSIDGVRNVFRRACTIHLPKKPSIHLAWAAFEEEHGSTEEAWEILQNIETNLPGLVMLSIRRIGFERRQGNHQEAEHLFKEYIENAKSTHISTFFAIKYARYAFQIMKNKQKAKDIITQALEKDKANIKLYLQLVDFEYQSPDTESDSEILKLFNTVINNEAFPLDTKISFSRRRLEYLEEFGPSVANLVEVYEDHQKLIKDHKLEEKKSTKGGERDTSSHHSSRKRGAEEDSSSSRKKSRGEGSANGDFTSQSQYNYGTTGSWDGSGYNQGSNTSYNYQQQQQQQGWSASGYGSQQYQYQNN